MSKRFRKPAVEASLRNKAVWLCLLCLFWIAPAWAGAVSQSDDLLHITTASILTIDSANPPPLSSTVDPDRLSGQWDPITLPYRRRAHPLALFGKDKDATTRPSAATRPAVTRTYWYRLAIEGLAPAPHGLELELLHWQARGQLAIYADGQLRYRSIASPAWNAFQHGTLFVPLTHAADMPAPKTILIRIDTPLGDGSALSSVYVGDSAILRQHDLLHEWFASQLPSLATAIYIVMGSFSLAVWMLRKRDTLYLLFFILTISSALHHWHFYAERASTLVPDHWLGWISFNSLSIEILALQRFLTLLHGRQRPRLEQALAGIFIVLSIVTLPFWVPYSHGILVNPVFALASALLSGYVIFTNAYDAWHSDSKEARLLCTWLLASLIIGIRDWYQNVWYLNIEGAYLFPYAMMVQFAISGYIMVGRYTGALSAIEKFNASLALTLKAREAELSESYRRLLDIEKRQMQLQERERLMQDMHDGLGLSLISAQRSVAKGDIAPAAVAALLSRCIDDFKLAIDSLEPVDADLLLLLAMIRYRLGTKLEEAGIALAWNVAEVPALDWLDPPSALHILRIVQESFANAVTHAQATRVSVSTAVEAGFALVSVADNGRGMPVRAHETLAGAGKGLANQQRRAHALGGKLSWRSDADGTEMTLYLPIHRPATEDRTTSTEDVGTLPSGTGAAAV